MKNIGRFFVIFNEFSFVCLKELKPTIEGKSVFGFVFFIVDLRWNMLYYPLFLHISLILFLSQRLFVKEVV